MAPFIVLSLLKNICTYLPNLEELSFRIVLLFPNAYNNGLHDSILFYIECDVYKWLNDVNICIQYLVDYVLPAPDSPEITIACFDVDDNELFILEYAFPAIM